MSNRVLGLYGYRISDSATRHSLAQEPSTCLFAHLISSSLLCRPFKRHSSKAFHHPTFTAIIHRVTFIKHESRRTAIPCDHTFLVWYLFETEYGYMTSCCSHKFHQMMSVTTRCDWTLACAQLNRSDQSFCHDTENV